MVDSARLEVNVERFPRGRLIGMNYGVRICASADRGSRLALVAEHEGKRPAVLLAGHYNDLPLPFSSLPEVLAVGFLVLWL
jgi:hypothetical protein